VLGHGKKEKITRQQALASRPMQLVKCDLMETADGGAKLKVPLNPRRRGGWLFRLPEGATKTFELDSLGLFVWRSCDGKTSVQQIIRKIAKDHGLSLREVEVATVQFLQMLVKKGLVGMTVPQKKDHQADAK
jgi:hypothetical protein